MYLYILKNRRRILPAPYRNTTSNVSLSQQTTKQANDRVEWLLNVAVCRSLAADDAVYIFCIRILCCILYVILPLRCVISIYCRISYRGVIAMEINSLAMAARGWRGWTRENFTSFQFFRLVATPSANENECGKLRRRRVFSSFVVSSSRCPCNTFFILDRVPDGIAAV